MKQYRVAIIGVTGLVGQTFLEVLQQVMFPIETLDVYASDKSQGQVIQYLNQNIVIKPLNEQVFNQQYDFVFMAVDAKVSKQYSEKLSALGAYVIDNSSAFRHDENKPLVAYGANEAVLKPTDKLIANPNCSTIQSVVALKPLTSITKITVVDYVSYQAVSGSGQAGLNDYLNQTENFYPKPIFGNVIPQIDDFLPDGYTKEEAKMIYETNRILSLNIPITATCVRVPVITGHSVVATVTTQDALELETIESIYQKEPLIRYYPGDTFPTPLDVVGQDLVHVGRLRKDPNNPHRLLLWNVADNLRKGAASNAIEIAQYIIKQQWI